MFPTTVLLFNLTVPMTITNVTNSSSIIMSILIGICLSLIALTTAFGNIIVLLAFYCDNKLRTINDYFILNMAIADFLIGSFCIPFYIPFSITQSWPFGRLFCKIWVTIDDVATMASVINIVAISINRYWSIAYPIAYRKYVRQHFVYLVMGAVWCLSFLNFAPGIWLLSLFNDNNHTDVNRSDCSGDYNHSFAYMLIAQFNYFIWPFIVLCVLNMLIMLNIWKRSRKMTRFMSFAQCEKARGENIFSSTLGTSKDTEDDQRLSILSKEKLNSIERCPPIIIEEETENIDQLITVQSSTSNKNLSHLSNQNTKSLNTTEHPYLSSFIDQYSPVIQNKSLTTKTRCHFSKKENSKLNRGSSPMIFLSRKSLFINHSVSRNHLSDSLVEYRVEGEVEDSRVMTNEIRSTHRTTKSATYRQRDSRITRDRKAARSLFILVIVFLIFLFPYVICATASTAGANISGLVFEISFWLLWLNSTCNPFLYPFIQIKYRRAYVKLFQCCLNHLTFSRSNHSF